MTDDALTSRANVVLHLDNGAEMQFSGRPFAGGSWFDDETGELTRQKLYTTESGEHVYSIVTSKGQQRSRTPSMSDLRESGAIEQDADIVSFLYREDYYDKETENQHITEVILAKHRNGPVGSVKLYFKNEFTLFLNLDTQHEG